MSNWRDDLQPWAQANTAYEGGGDVAEHSGHNAFEARYDVHVLSADVDFDVGDPSYREYSMLGAWSWTSAGMRARQKPLDFFLVMHASHDRL